MSRSRRRSPASVDPRIERLRSCIDTYAGRYRTLRGARDLEAYLAAKEEQADEELLTEPLLGDIIERVLGFPKDAYFPQLGKSGLKPNFTPIDLVAHRFVLDAKGTDERLARHEHQIRTYVDQRALDSGVLFNLREARVFHRGQQGYDQALSFALLPLWKLARGEALPGPEVDRFLRFCDRFAYREMGLVEKIAFVRDQPPWSRALRSGEEVVVDVELLVEKLRVLSEELSMDAAALVDVLDNRLKLNPGRQRKLVEELELIALDLPREPISTSFPTGSRAGGRPGRSRVATVSRQGRVSRSDQDPPLPSMGGRPARGRAALRRRLRRRIRPTVRECP